MHFPVILTKKEVRPPGRVSFDLGYETKMTSGQFQRDFIRVVGTSNPDDLEKWLINNARNMREEMFFDGGVTWDCEDYQLLVLRAFAPKGVFTDDAKEGFLSQVNGDEDFVELVDALFGDDDDLTSLLPSRLETLEDYLAQCMQSAYRHSIRKESEC